MRTYFFLLLFLCFAGCSGKKQGKIPDFQIENWEQKKQEVKEALGGITLDQLFSWGEDEKFVNATPFYIIYMEGFRYPRDSSEFLTRAMPPFPLLEDYSNLSFCDPAEQFSWVIFPPDEIMPKPLLGIKNKICKWYFEEGIDKEPINSEKRNLKNIIPCSAGLIPISLWVKGEKDDLNITKRIVFPGHIPPYLKGWRLMDYQMSDIFVTNLSQDKDGIIIELSTRPFLVCAPVSSLSGEVRLNKGRAILYIKK